MSWRHLLGLAACLAAPTIVHAQPESLRGCENMVKAIGMPEVRGDRDFAILCRTGHLLAHADETRTPIWVAERLKPARFAGDADRQSLCRFKKDGELEAEGRPFAVDADYKAKSQRERRSFDRGHMAPAADMKWDETAMRESCLLSNIAPQQGLNLNRHIWADLEALVRDWTCDRRDLYVITGPIYDDADPDTLGANRVSVPTAFFKMAYEPRQMRTIAFILPNAQVNKQGRPAADVLRDFIVKPSEIERRAGLRFFAAMAPRDRNRLLSNASPLWKVVQGCAAGATGEL